jgi:hypothetical protein
VRRSDKRQEELADLDRLVEEIVVNAHSESEQLTALCQALNDEAGVPCDAFVVGVPVAVTAFDFDGNERRGITAKCRMEGGAVHVVAAADVSARPGTKAARYLAAYRRWLGLDPVPVEPHPRAGTVRDHKASESDLDLAVPLDLVVLALRDKAARCRLLGSDRTLTLRAERLWSVAPGEILTVRPRKQWRYAGHPYLSGEIVATRLDAAALGMVPLGLEPRGEWDPAKAYWGEEKDPLPRWAEAIIAHGPRPAFEMEQVIPGEDPDDPDSDPIIESNERKLAGDHVGARKLLMDLCQGDLRCLDAHAHLGNMELDAMPKDAIRHYEVGVRIGELSLGADFSGVLAWGWLDNRPFLRCLHGYGLSLWRLSRFEEAERLFERVLWLDPSDALGERFNLFSVKAREAYTEERRR